MKVDFDFLNAWQFFAPDFEFTRYKKPELFGTDKNGDYYGISLLSGFEIDEEDGNSTLKLIFNEKLKNDTLEDLSEYINALLNGSFENIKDIKELEELVRKNYYVFKDETIDDITSKIMKKFKEIEE